MKASISFKPFVAVAMAMIMSNIPTLAVADEGMISTTAVVNELSRKQAQQKVNEMMARADVRGELVKRGISPDEAAQRLSQLSDQELNQLSQEMNRAQYGGDILVTILLIVLIIYLIKRI